MEETKLRVLEEEKSKLEEKYCVRISSDALDLAIRSFESFDFEGMSEDAPLGPFNILDGACKLVLDKFRSCAYECDFYESAYELRQALVDVIELYRDSHPDSQSWLSRAKLERDSASIRMNDILHKLDDALKSSEECETLFSDCTQKLIFFMDGESNVDHHDCSTLNKDSSSTVAREVGWFLDDIQYHLIDCFKRLLTVKPCHVAEALSSLTDVPISLILNLKEMVKYKIKQRVTNQDHVIDEIFEVVGSERCMTMRPRGSILLLGPSSVGKREISKAIAEHWYCDLSRLVEIDMSEYKVPHLESETFDISQRAMSGYLNMWDRLTEAVRKRPYSVILLDKIDKASSAVMEDLLEVLSVDTPTNIEGNPVDFSKSIIFMTSNVGADQLLLTCKCYTGSLKYWNLYRCNPQLFQQTHDCTLKGSGCERVVIEAMKFFNAKLFGSLDKVLVVEKFCSSKVVARLLLRDIVREITGRKFVVHVSDSALDVLLGNASTGFHGAGNAIKMSLHEHVTPQLLDAEVHGNAAVCVDTFAGTDKLSFRFQLQEQSMVDWYFKQKNGTFSTFMEDVRMKVESVCNFFSLRKKWLSLMDHPGQTLSQLGPLLFDVLDSILSFSSLSNPPPQCVSEEGTSGSALLAHFPMDEEKENIKNLSRRLRENDTGLAEATSVIVDAVLKIIDDPTQLADLTAKHYLFLGLSDDAITGLINNLTESLKTGSGKSLFTYFNLRKDCSSEVKKFIIDEMKERPCKVLLFDGIEFADAALYRSLLEILDMGTLDDGEGFTVDFRKTIVILTSEAANKHTIARCFNYQLSYISSNMPRKKNVERFRTELLHRVDEIIFFDPFLPEHGDILRFRKYDLFQPADDIIFNDPLLCEHHDVLRFTKRNCREEKQKDYLFLSSLLFRVFSE